MPGDTKKIECPHCRASLDVARDPENPFFQCGECGQFFELTSKQESAAIQQPPSHPKPLSAPPQTQTTETASIPERVRRRRSRGPRVGCGCLLILIAMLWAVVYAMSWLDDLTLYNAKEQGYTNIWRSLDAEVAFDQHGNPIRVVFLSDAHLHAGLVAVRSQPTIRALDLTRAKATDNDLALLSPCDWIEDLKLEGTQVTDSGLEVIADSFSQLRRLDLKDTKVTDQGLANLVLLGQLEMLGLSKTKVTDDGMQFVQYLRNLRVIYLGDTEITGASLAHLKRSQNLVTINLRNTNVNDSGLEHLRSLNQLEYLYLGGTGVTDVGMIKLGSLENLVAVNVYQTKVTKEGAGYLERRMKNGVVVIDTP